ncbi:MAG: penicillin-binding protein 2 [Alphaproteobacteria bacterium]
MIAALFRRRRPSLVRGGETFQPEIPPVRLDGSRARALETGRARLIVTGGFFLLAFVVIAGRLVEISALKVDDTPRHARQAGMETVKMERGDIVDRSGIVLATSLPTVNLYADPREINDAADAAKKLAAVLPELNQADLTHRLDSERTFVYLKRNLTPNLQYEVNRLGIPGLYFERGERRVYPHGTMAAHVIGMTDVDNHGVAGLEKSFDEMLRANREPLRLSIDMRVQHIVREELARSVEEFHALGATGIVMDARTGELVAMVSLPDFNPNSPGADPDGMFNRSTLGVYEMGSTFKLFTAAAALDLGVARLEDRYDATNPIQIANFTIKDYHAQKRWLTVPEIMVHSSNIGAAKMAMDVGTKSMKGFLGKLGLLTPPNVELSEVGAPLVPTPWREISTMTISYGHGLAVTPLQMATAVSALVNGGTLHPATLVRRDAGSPVPGEKVLSPETSRKMRHLMRLVVEEGTGSKAEVPGYFVGGKTGTAEKNMNGRYARKALLSSFIAAFPMTDPRYVVMVIIDEPEGNKSTFGYATGGWTAAPAVGRVVERVAPLVGIAPVHTRWPGANGQGGGGQGGGGQGNIVQAVARGGAVATPRTVQTMPHGGEDGESE